MFEEMYDNEPTRDTSKISGKELRQREYSEDEMQYLKSITDGYTPDTL